ncbi:DUF4340 domain-containing protein [Candidatus Viadribacter manganicus]|uniref:DUF4340 domain-containing protein n=1 Tax=Candidatus Viadribacter manganicus TaxID=1759059 RepID=A0A1B1ADR8_9PROT|nr:DUF4340 domain-containing protein [Candidatus Viadribacter manganicus]ANP44696.1 hypothetical protein ATE48_01545 [Candidatus Viadribacter manganicus]
MTTGLAERRRARSLTLFLIAGALVATAAVTVAIESRSTSPSSAAGPVLPGIEDTIGGAQRITITSAEATYRIERTEQGWAMRDRDDYPVLSSRLAQLTEGLEALRYVRRMTNDASKHERLGVTDPRQGGRGVLVQIEDGRGALLVNLILGVETAGTYVRRPDQEQTWSVDGDLPPLRDVASWLDLRPINLTGDHLARVEVIPAEGRAYILARDGADQPWRLASPALAPLAQSTLTATAERITQLAPIDVRTAPAIQGTPRARVRATTFDGIVIDAELIASDNHTWVKLVARASAPEQEAAAVALNTPASDWAYALSDMEAEAFAPPLSRLIASAE